MVYIGCQWKLEMYSTANTAGNIFLRINLILLIYSNCPHTSFVHIAENSLVDGSLVHTPAEPVRVKGDIIRSLLPYRMHSERVEKNNYIIER